MILIAAALVSGCKPKVAYNVKSAPDYIYVCSVFKGELRDETPVFPDSPTAVMQISVSPALQKDSGVGVYVIKALTDDGKPTVYGDKYLGEMKIDLKSNGVIAEKFGKGRVDGIGDLFFELPDKRLKAGDSWSNVRNEDRSFSLWRSSFYFKKPVEYKYTFNGIEEHGGEKCAHILMTGGHNEEVTTPTGDVIATVYNRDGDIWFSLKKGRVQEAVYVQVIKFQALENGTGEVLIQAPDSTKYVYTIKK